MFDWNDLRHFLAVARTGSTLAASRQLRVSQATVSRRVTALESAMGVGLFTRSATGYALTPRGAALLPAAQEVETAVMALLARSDAESRRLSGTIRIATAEGASDAWVVPAVATFCETYPDVQIELQTGAPGQDLPKDEFDIMIRFGDKPTQDTLIVRHLADLDVTMYATRAIVDRFGMPDCYADLARLPLVGFSGSNAATDWFDRNVPGANFVYRANSVSGILSAVRAGLGAGIGPAFLDSESPDLVALFPTIPDFVTSAWLVTTETARQQPQVRAMIDHLVDHVVKSIRNAVGQTMAASTA